MTVLLLSLMLQTAGLPGEIILRHPSVPTEVETELRAECEGVTTRIRYVIRRPGLASISFMETGGVAVGEKALGLLNDMIAAEQLDRVELDSCATKAGNYESRVSLRMSGQRAITLGVSKRGLRMIHDGRER